MFIKEKLFRSGNVIYAESVKATPKLDQSCSLTLHFHYYGHAVNKAKFSWLICDRITGDTVVTYLLCGEFLRITHCVPQKIVLFPI